MNINNKILALVALSFVSFGAKAIELSELINGNQSQYESKKIKLKEQDFVDSSNQNMIDELNSIRSIFKLSPLEKDPSLSVAAYNHAYYLSAKNEISHEENKKDKLFTGVSPFDRALYAGYGKDNNYIKVGEVVSMYNGRPLNDDLQNFLTAIYHRLVILEPTFDDYGERRISNGKKSIAELKLGTLNEKSDVRYIFYPYSQMRNTPTTFLPYQEIPNPMPNYDKVGFPISFQISAENTLKVSRFSLVDSNGNIVPGKMLTNTNDPEISKSQFAFIPIKPLMNNTVYTANIVASANGWPDFSRSWSFETESYQRPEIITDKEQYSPGEIVSISYVNILDKKITINVKTSGSNKELLKQIGSSDSWGSSQYEVESGCQFSEGCNATYSITLSDGTKITKNFTILN